MRIFILLFGLVTCLVVSGQPPGRTRQWIVDSLFQLLPGSTGTIKADVLNQLSMELAPRNIDSAFRYATEAGRISGELDYLKGRGESVFNYGNCYYFEGDVKNAISKYHTALRLLEPLEPSREVGNVLYMLATLNHYVRNTKKVTEYYKRAASNYLLTGDSLAYVNTICALGSSYAYILMHLRSTDSAAAATFLPMMDSSIRYNQIWIDYFRRSGYSNPWKAEKGGLEANFYTYHACYYWARGDTLGLRYAQLSLDASREIRDPVVQGIFEGLSLSNLVYSLYFDIGDKEKGIEYAKYALMYLRDGYRTDIYAATLSLMGYIERDRGNVHRALHYQLQALAVSDTFLVRASFLREHDPTFRYWGSTQMRWNRILFLEEIASIYESLGDFKSALLYRKKVRSERELQSRDELTRQVIGLEGEYEDDMKREELNRLKRDNELQRLQVNRARFFFGGLGASILVLFLASVVIIQRRRFHSEQRSLVLEQKLLRSQMNPHFIFNSLTNIQNFILTEKPDKASIYLSKFANLVRSILDHSIEESVALEKEINTIENYLELQKIRFSGKFEYRIRIDDNIDADTIRIPPMLAQPFIENSIEHGIKHRTTPGNIEIRFTLEGKILVFEVEDDGIGRERAREIGILKDPYHKSLATLLTRERLANLNRNLKAKIRLEIHDLKNSLGEATGTKVRFGIPVYQ